MYQDRLTLETPEHAEVHLELAGIGSRFLAGFIDSLLQALIILGIGLAIGSARWGLSGDPAKVPFYVAVAAASAMLIVIVYYMVFELLWGGQSPGKRLAGLVVVRDDGGPIAFTESAVRNILRVVDILPIYYTVGMISIFFTRSCKRIGDLAAGTVVIKMRDFVPRAVETIEAAPPPDSTGPQALTDPLVQRAQAHLLALTAQETDTLSRFMERRMELAPDSRRAVAQRIADSLRPKFPSLSPLETPDPEVFLEIIHQARAASSRKAAPDARAT